MKLVPFGSICKLQNGRAFKPSDWSEKGDPIVRIQNLNNESKPFNYCNFSVEERFHINTGDLLFSWSGTPGTSFGAFFWNRGFGVLNQHIFRVDVDENKISKDYLRYAINSQLNYIIDQAHGGVGLKHITKGKLEAVEIPLPPLDEQKRIAAILDKADAIRCKRQQAIQLADDFLRSVFLDMFGDPVTNPKGWEIKKISDVVTKVTDGVHFKPEYLESGIPFISVKDITTGELKFDNTKFISKEAHEKYIRRCNPEYLDILYTKIGATYGRPTIIDVKKDFSLYVSVALLKPDHSKINPYFLKEVLATSALKRQADRSIKGAGVPDLHLIEIKKFILPVPCMEIQNDFVNKTSNIRMKIKKIKLSIKRLDELFNSLSQKAFAGEL
ncbi:restriction endonuclease subunit S [Colwellia sp. MB3u-70]|uniref:restriction endonuclease subunit S n=1 Tax=unclassified Colwellia TaxID=196834 RepID=UPI0015F4ABC9|nr:MULTISPECIES: restriction endonuclease subunit S [unclassified Colwellia]MBA6292856.1 restriction endonuclease subunit S [Colwellia sp. MB3u-8]MBA6308060.1 restriction endonuclease subunit S [Colwellia sp. MB3u-70]